jgi:acetyl-CoA synthetase
MKVAGHRMTTAELENAITDHQSINETAVVPIPHEIKGEVPVAFVILKHKIKNQEKFEKEIKKLTDNKIGPTARPAKIYIVEALPKTRSGKIMRRILKALLIDEKPKGLSTLLNPKSVEAIKEIIKSNQ